MSKMTQDERLLAQFRTGHLRDDLKAASEPFAECARALTHVCAPSAERTLALRKLFEAKNLAVMGFLLDTEEAQRDEDEGEDGAT